MSIATTIDIANTNTLVCDVMDVHGEKARLLKPLFRNYGGRTQAHGSVRTIKCFEDSSKIHEILDADGRGCFLVVDGGGSTRHSVLGGNMALKAKANGWLGVIVNGCVRDVAELREVDIAIFALGACPRHSFKRGLGDIDVSVRFAGETIKPGNYMYADEDGIVVADKSLHEE